MREESKEGWLTISCFVCVCVLQVTWRANGIVLYMYEGNVLMDMCYYG